MDKKSQSTAGKLLNRRTVLKGLGAAAATPTIPLASRFAQAASSEPIKLGAPIHRTGIGASYGRWFEIACKAAVAEVNKKGGINGRKVELFIEDDGTDPQRGTAVVEKFGKQYKVDGQLAERAFVAGDHLTLADIALGNSIYLWFNFPIERPDLSALKAWHDRLSERPGFQKFLVIPLA